MGRSKGASAPTVRSLGIPGVLIAGLVLGEALGVLLGPLLLRWAASAG
jgi:hypothetical protein